MDKFFRRELQKLLSTSTKAPLTVPTSQMRFSSMITSFTETKWPNEEEGNTLRSRWHVNDVCSGVTTEAWAESKLKIGGLQEVAGSKRTTSN